MASAPLPAVSICILVLFSRFCATVRFMRVSSTTKICASGARKDSLYASVSRMLVSSFSWKSLTGSKETTFWGRRIVNSDPSPYLLSTWMVPPIRSSRFFVMASPRPVPSIVFVCCVSTRWNFANSLSMSSGLMPIPVSDTEMIRQICLVFCVAGAGS